MGLFNWLNRNRINPSDKKQKWEDTDEGKDFMERYKASLEKRKLLKEEWERTTPPDKKEQVKLFQVIFPIFFLGYVAALFWGFKTNKELMVLACTCCISLISLVLFFIKPKFVKYPNCFMMPVIAFGCAAVIYVYLGFEFGFNYKTRGKEKVDIFYKKNETDEIERTLNERKELSIKEFENLDYSKFLADNKIEKKWEPKADCLNHWGNIYD